MRTLSGITEAPTPLVSQEILLLAESIPDCRKRASVSPGEGQKFFQINV